MVHIKEGHSALKTEKIVKKWNTYIALFLRHLLKILICSNNDFVQESWDLLGTYLFAMH